jgi:hypothetical protein
MNPPEHADKEAKFLMETSARSPRRRALVSPAHADQIRTRERVRDLAEVYTHKREVDAMLDLVADMFPSKQDPRNTDRKFFEPAAGSGNFLEEILRRKLAFITIARYRRAEVYEHRILRALASIYAIDIDPDNVQECKDRLRAVLNSHLDNDLNTRVVSDGFASAVDVMLETNIICADTLKDAHAIEFVDYQPRPRGTFVREWSPLEQPGRQLGLFGRPGRDETPVHYSQLAQFPGPLASMSVKDGK